MPDNQKLLANLGALRNMVRRVAVEAGDITLEYFEDCEALEKADGSPVTIADQQAEAFIQKALADILPGVPFVGEESADIKTVAESEYFWLVDPLDGTKEFISGSGDYTVNIALVREAKPVMGVVYAPVKGELYAGHEGGTALRWMAESDVEKEIHVRPGTEGGITVVSSKNHANQERLDEFLAGFKVKKLVKRGSSLKICTIAAGKADLYPRFGPTCYWDTAAGQAVLEAAGGQMTDTEGRALRYDLKAESFLNPEFIASSFDWRGEDSEV